ncbi:MAG: DUF2064 domain-containing protein [Planctomycetes bacterium]|nr:DUF2064 domain-containing protein [Planctomycetota bacterium]
MTRARLVVLARPPAYGRCKSRLAATLGPGEAARLARAMHLDALDVADAAARAHDAELLLATDDLPSAYPLGAVHAAHVPQDDGDLGRRMARLVARAAADGVPRVLLLGTDAPALPAAHLAAALAALDVHDLVLGPVDDGGFWCLGARLDGASAAADVLRDERWLDALDWDAVGTRARVAERARAPAGSRSATRRRGSTSTTSATSRACARRSPTAARRAHRARPGHWPRSTHAPTTGARSSRWSSPRSTRARRSTRRSTPSRVSPVRSSSCWPTAARATGASSARCDATTSWPA